MEFKRNILKVQPTPSIHLQTQDEEEGNAPVSGSTDVQAIASSKRKKDFTSPGRKRTRLLPKLKKPVKPAKPTNLLLQPPKTIVVDEDLKVLKTPWPGELATSPFSSDKLCEGDKSKTSRVCYLDGSKKLQSTSSVCEDTTYVCSSDTNNGPPAKVRRFEAANSYFETEFDLAYPILADGSVQFDSDLDDTDFDSDKNLIVEKPSTRVQIGPRRKNRDLVKVVRQYKWVLVKEKDGKKTEEISPVWFLTSHHCLQEVEYRRTLLKLREAFPDWYYILNFTAEEIKAQLELKGVKTSIKIIRRLAPFETEKPLAKKVYAYLLLGEFNACVSTKSLLLADPKEKAQLVTKHAEACHSLISVYRLRMACLRLAAKVEEFGYVRVVVARQVLKEADPFDVLLKDEYSFEYEYQEIFNR